MLRKTIKTHAALEGIGLHRGKPSRVVFLPAAGPTGLRFSGPGSETPVPALLTSVAGTARGTNIRCGETVLYTVEHLLSAAAGLGLDDLDMEISGEEPPAMDGSALPFAEALLKAGITDKAGQESPAAAAFGAFEFSAGESRYRAEPRPGPLSVKLIYDYPHKLVGRQELEFTLSAETYRKEVAPARTFGFSHELEALKAAGLARGGSLDNAVVITETEILARNGLRFPDEFVRHKLLDLLGDLALSGLPLSGMRIEAERSGHAANVNFAKLLLEKAQKQ
ncbi:MAG: UDP-3-O-[3-hydroxymyristoyl] N-acetylglucosamine deacetylase [Elusimicrobia bacterium CG08_land_8_20_14_0_20_59_10]|nr:MAG: UDP-3-O-[3-hydroxymyristoyl] N-acetylglucosamine deacetylase [Elusimicrobia bacterium CG08_land_8_20_14_0_20_59_10]